MTALKSNSHLSKKNVLFASIRDLEVDEYQSNLYVMLKQFLLFYEFYDFSCRRYSLMNRPCYNNLFQFMQHDNFRNLNRVISIYWIHLESWVKAFWYCFRVIKKYTFHYLKNSVPIRGNQSSFKILQLFDTWRYQSLVILFFSCVVILM